MSRTQARRLQWYAAESIALKESEMKLLVNKYTTGAVGAQVAKLRAEGISFNIEKLWAEMKKKIISGLQRSKAPVETIAEGET